MSEKKALTKEEILEYMKTEEFRQKQREFLKELVVSVERRQPTMAMFIKEFGVRMLYFNITDPKQIFNLLLSAVVSFLLDGSTEDQQEMKKLFFDQVEKHLKVTPELLGSQRCIH
ncbi:MAG: hypothetical protein AMJ45_04365 [Syntrophobacter sp. DG_60]|nr:MAG: hypothetical protein AMJ45_04365 [Syntrophobacter sp. DG_60]